ncbi:hypothetical protein RGQ29_031429 [Quercus rubra]|uniref:SAM domain-containing protein n=1 Tax=Quercus rubra TaxID=3512 RepID=A0AAN7EKB1_QUERU|nr:hypothetical protein RGQ29_031429 [Quercus rubra]
MKQIPRVFEERRKLDQSQKLSKTIQPARHNMQQQRTFNCQILEGLDTSELVMQLTPISGIVQRSFHSVEESLTVTSLLQSLGLGRYNIPFQAEVVDMSALKQMGDKDLKDMGTPMGLRKKIHLALWPPSR